MVTGTALKAQQKEREKKSKGGKIIKRNLIIENVIIADNRQCSRAAREREGDRGRESASEWFQLPKTHKSVSSSSCVFGGSFIKSGPGFETELKALSRSSSRFPAKIATVLPDTQSAALLLPLAACKIINS